MTFSLRIVENRVFLRCSDGRASRAGVPRLPSATPHGTLLYLSDRPASPWADRLPQETLAKFKRLLSLARRSIEENQRQITEKDGQLLALREALTTAENARRRCVCGGVCGWIGCLYVCTSGVGLVCVMGGAKAVIGTAVIGNRTLIENECTSDRKSRRRPKGEETAV